ncbi:MAG: hypothetical protein PHC60_01605 [Heliobacteriaceae bacterium]|nr:hypothetical protein [Heliobacteriaceae bacterium]MDD4587072.1 hypothetical protein [Heliobacteriaceae bacterium]
MPGEVESIGKTSKAYPVLFLILAVPILLLGVLSAAQVTGIVDVTGYLRQVPLINRIVPAADPAKRGFQQTLEEQQIATLQAEKTELADQLAAAQTKLATGQSREAAWQAEKTTLEQQVASLNQQVKKLDQTRLENAELVERLAVMKPVNAARILENLPDDAVNMLLAGMETDTAAKIMAVFEPVRAARLAYPAAKEALEARSKAELSKANLAGLGRTLAAMRAEDAVAVIEQLPDSMAAAILKEMNGDAAGRVLSSLTAQNPAKAGSLVSLLGTG